MADKFSTLLANSFVQLELGNIKASADNVELLIDKLVNEPSIGNAADVVTIASICSKILHSGEMMEIAFIEKICSITTGYLGAEHLMSLSAELQLASVLLVKGHQERAEKTALELLDRCEQILGKDNSLTVQCAILLVSLYSKKADIVSGQELLSRIPGLQNALFQFLLGKD